MSVTLTDRDLNTLELSLGGADAKGVIYGVSGGVPNDYKVGYARHTMPTGVASVMRHNLRLERRVAGSLGRRTISVDITIAVPNDIAATADQVDDLLTSAFSYFDSEGTVADFLNGVSRS